jgi:hypothetical protein
MSYGELCGYAITPITSTTTAAGEVILPATPNANVPGEPQYTNSVKSARITIRSISGGSVILGGDTTSASPVILKASDVGTWSFDMKNGVGAQCTANKALTYTATGSNLDYTIEAEVLRLRNDL